MHLTVANGKCARCHIPMFRTHLVEQEEWTGHALVTHFFKDECSGCGLMLICVIPMLPEQIEN